MQLAITVLGSRTDTFVAELLSAINSCQCSVLELRTSNLTEITAVYVLLDGNWNHVAKLEGLLDILRNRFQMQISLLRPEELAVAQDVQEGVPYTLETISMEKKDLLYAVTSFLLDRGVVIDEISANLHPALMFSNQIFSTRFTLLVPPNVRILSLREEFLDFCDGLNIDAILEPIKR
ncbi:glycine cleavage system protein R [Methylomonas rapida]|jgi:Glycine cleavage system regulatory protein|uniref:Glycine cleavage system transcriptional repressor n=1 Tax=Methylomonas rapida TaxID=2963939 RepID=A0ABY7GPJ0_9GAMM|nr:ACT domain-containing protein [Methylomonas rapida]WAR46384.1 transcriptional regulator [Methylomonas rapida]